MKNTEILQAAFVPKEASDYAAKALLGSLLAGGTGAALGGGIGGTAGGIKGVANARPGMVAQDAVDGAVVGAGTGAATGAGALLGMGTADLIGVLLGARNGGLRTAIAGAGALGGGYLGNRAGKSIASSFARQGDKDIKRRKSQLDKQTGDDSEKKASSADILATHIHKEAAALALGKGLGALGKRLLPKLGLGAKSTASQLTHPSLNTHLIKSPRTGRMMTQYTKRPSWGMSGFSTPPRPAATPARWFAGGASKTASILATHMAKEAMEKEAMGLIGKGVGALAKGGLNKALSYGAKAWSAPMKFMSRGLGDKSSVGKFLGNYGGKLSRQGDRAAVRARQSARGFGDAVGESYHAAKGPALTPAARAAKSEGARNAGATAEKWMGRGVAGAGAAGLIAAPSIAGATGIPGAQGAANLAAWGPLWAGGEKLVDMYQGAGQRGATQATGAMLNHMQNMPLSARLAYLMAPGAAAQKMQGIASQRLPNLEEFMRKTYA